MDYRCNMLRSRRTSNYLYNELYVLINYVIFISRAQGKKSNNNKLLCDDAKWFTTWQLGTWQQYQLTVGFHERKAIGPNS